MLIPKKATGFDLIIKKREFPRNVSVKLTNLINAPFRLKYEPRKWKEVNMKTGKRPHETKSYRSINFIITDWIKIV